VIGLVAAADAHAWWDKSWSHRRKLTFDNAARAETLSGFQVLVVLNSGRIDYDKTRNDGYDLRFLDANDQTLLDYEIESWDESGNSYV
jgi:biopolymer transport protein ExbB